MHIVRYTTLTLQLVINSNDTREKLRLNFHSLSVNVLLEYGRKPWAMLITRSIPAKGPIVAFFHQLLLVRSKSIHKIYTQNFHLENPSILFSYFYNQVLYQWGTNMRHLCCRLELYKFGPKMKYDRV
jgi:hypothetical protein